MGFGSRGGMPTSESGALGRYRAHYTYYTFLPCTCMLAQRSLGCSRGFSTLVSFGSCVAQFRIISLQPTASDSFLVAVFQPVAETRLGQGQSSPPLHVPWGPYLGTYGSIFPCQRAGISRAQSPAFVVTSSQLLPSS